MEQELVTIKLSKNTLCMTCKKKYTTQSRLYKELLPRSGPYGYCDFYKIKCIDCLKNVLDEEDAILKQIK
jgi:hypothetical protein